MIGSAYKSANFFGSFGVASPQAEERDLLKSDLRSINKRCYDLHRNNPQAKAISRIIAEFVGSTNYKLNVPQSQELQKRTEKWMKNCTVRGDNYQTFRKQRITEIVEGGGVLTLFTQDPERKPDEIGLKLDLVEAGRVCTPPEITDGKEQNGVTVYSGIAYNAQGKEIGFYYKNGDSYSYIAKYNSFGMLNAYFERSPESERPNTSKPIPLIAPIVQGLEYRDKIIQNMVQWTTNVSALGAFFETSDPSAIMQGMGLKNDDGDLDTEKLAGTTHIAGNIPPNILGMTPIGTKLHLITPDGSANFEPVLKIVNRDNASGVGIPEEILANATDGKNFAVSKFVSQSFIKKIQNWARTLNVLDSLIVYQTWEEAEMRGLLVYMDESAEWGGSADFDDVDASKSADASQKRVAGLSSTFTKETARRGGDFEENVTTTAKEIQTIKEIAEKHGTNYDEFMAFIQGQSRNSDVGVSVTASAEQVEKKVEENAEDN